MYPAGPVFPICCIPPPAPPILGDTMLETGVPIKLKFTPEPGDKFPLLPGAP